MDLADIMYSLFRIIAPQRGSLLHMAKRGFPVYRDDTSLRYRSLRYPIHSPEIARGSNLSGAAAAQEHLYIGPVDDITFLDYPRQLHPNVCGPFDTERGLMEAFAFYGKHPTRDGGKLGCWAFEKTLEVYEVVAQWYLTSSQSTFEEEEIFHLAHGDLSGYNILIDPDTGAITDIID